MAAFTYIAHSERDTAELAGKIAALAIPGAVITLDGDLGAGKTRFSQGFARAIGVKEIVNSPTFTIIKEYEGASLPFYHMDVYRLTQDDAEELGLDEYFYGEGVTLIEWSSLIDELLPEDRLEIVIQRIFDENVGLDINGSGKREFRIVPHGDLYFAWCRELKENGWISW
jgi:tRNA threonylcarbamoyladenosine biosynthesis protein TsaE